MSKSAIELLREDHKKVKNLLSELVHTTIHAETKRRLLLDKISQDIRIHLHIEEEIFYPAFKQAGNANHAREYFQALEEHRAVDEWVLPDLKKTSPTSKQFSARAKLLKELLEHHIQEDEKGMFKKATKTMAKVELAELGQKMAARKQEMKRQMSRDQAALQKVFSGSGWFPMHPLGKTLLP